MKNRKKLNKKGFISSSIIITFVVLFLLLMIALLEKYINTRRNVQKSAEDIREDLNAKVKGKDGILLYSIISKKYDAMLAVFERDQYPNCDKDETDDGEYCINHAKNENYEVYKFSKDYMDYNSPVFFYWQHATHNNVIFADRCWKIIRTTETGGVKLLYVGLPTEDGTCEVVTNKDGIGKAAYNSQNNRKEYVGYTYKLQNTTNEQNSNLKTKIDEFLTSVVKPVSYFVEDAHWCNDRSQPTVGNGTAIDFGPKRRLGNILEPVKKMYARTETVILTDYADATSYFSQLSSDQPVEIYWIISGENIGPDLVDYPTPSCTKGWAKIASGENAGKYVCYDDLSSTTSTNEDNINVPEKLYCIQEADRYTVSPIINYVKGNQLLEDVGISGATITADEVYMIYDNSRDPQSGTNYLTDDYNGFWTMSPVDFDGTKASVYAVSDYGYLVSSEVNNDTSYGVRPAISLKYNTYVYETVNGIRSDGSAEKPYHVITDLKRYITVNINDDLFYANSDNGYDSGIRVDFDEDGLKTLVLDGEFSQNYKSLNKNLELFTNTPTETSSPLFKITIKWLSGTVTGDDLYLYVKVNDTHIIPVALPSSGFSEETFTGMPKDIYVQVGNQKFADYSVDIELTRENTIYERYDDGWYKIDGNNYKPIYNLKTDLASSSETEWTMPTDFRSGYTFKGYCSRRGGGASYLVVHPSGEIKSGMTTEFSYTGTLYAWWDKDYVPTEENP